MPSPHARRRPIRRLALAAAAAVAAIYVALVGGISQLVVAPPRPTIDRSERATIGVVVADLPGTGTVVRRSVAPARSAGIRPGDVLVRVGERRIASTADVVEAVRATADGAMLRIEARRTDDTGETGAVLVDVPVVVRPISPGDTGVPFSAIAFTDSAGRTLRGWYVPPPGDGPAPAVVYAHGNATDRRQWLPIVWTVHRAGAAQVLFDFAGRGQSEGSTITLGPQEADGLSAAVGFVVARPEVDPARVALVGRSMGAAAAILAAQGDARVRALVLDSPYADLVGVLDDTLRSRWIPPVLVRGPVLAVVAVRARFEPRTVRPIDALARLDVPVLLTHGAEDRVVPLSHARDLAAAAPDRVRLIVWPDLGHNDARPPDLDRTIVEFLSVPLGLGRNVEVTEP